MSEQTAEDPIVSEDILADLDEEIKAADEAARKFGERARAATQHFQALSIAREFGERFIGQPRSALMAAVQDAVKAADGGVAEAAAEAGRLQERVRDLRGFVRILREKAEQEETL